MRSFIAVSLEPNREIASLMNTLEPLKGSRVPNSPMLHVTLAFLGDITEQEKGQFCSVLSEIRFSRFDLRTTSVGAFPGLNRARVAFVGLETEPMKDLHRELNSRIPEKFRDKREFVPHLTVSRFKVPTDIRGLYREYEGRDFGTYPVSRLSLYKSDLTPKGAIYTEMCGVQLI